MPFATHDVINQPPPRVGHNVFTEDTALTDALDREGAGWAAADISDLGEFAGSEQAMEWGRLANENQPILQTHDKYGYRIDRID